MTPPPTGATPADAGPAEARASRSASDTPETARIVRLAALGVLAAVVGAVAAFEVFAPPDDPHRQAAPPPAAPAKPAAPMLADMVASAPAPVLRFRPISPVEAYLANAAIPDSRTPDPPAHPFTAAAATRTDRALASTCLTQVVYYEAQSESLLGQQAVAQVVLNRVRDPRFPKTVCGVVFQGSALRTGCQFSFTCDGSMRRPLSAAPWRRAHAVAEAALGGFVMTAIGHATHYHTVWVTPYWSPSLVKWGRIGAHIFYRWAGTPTVATAAYVGGEAGPEPAAEEPSPPMVAEAEPPPQQPQTVERVPSDPPAAEPLQSAPPPPVADAPEPVPPPYRAAPRRASVDSPAFAARDQGR